MKKSLLTGLIFALIIPSLVHSEESIMSLAVNIPETGTARELRVMHDLYGGAYVLYIAGNKLNIIHADRLGRWENYAPEGFSMPASARDIQLSASGPVQYAAFVGAERGAERLYVFRLDYQGELIYCPLDESATGQAITRYTLESAYTGNASVFLLSGGRLSCIANVGEWGKPLARQELSASGEQVEDFGLFFDIQQNSRRGWYRASRHTAGADIKPEITLFSLSENGLLWQERAGMNGVISAGLTPDGALTCSIVDGTQVAVYLGTEPAGNTLNKVVAFDAGAPATRYYSTIQTGGEAGLLIGDGVVSRVWREASGAPLVEEWLTDVETEDLFYTGEQFGFLYRQNGAWRSALLSPGTGVSTAAAYTAGISALPDTAALRYNVITWATPRFYALHNNSLLACELDGQTWALKRSIPLPEDGTGEALAIGQSAPLIYADTPIVPLISPRRLALYEPDTGRIQVIACEQISLSRRINGELLLAVCADNSITIYRQGEAL